MIRVKNISSETVRVCGAGFQPAVSLAFSSMQDRRRDGGATEGPHCGAELAGMAALQIGALRFRLLRERAVDEEKNS